MLRPKRLDVNERFDEGVLRGFIRVGRVAQIVKRDLGGAALMFPNDVPEAFPGAREIAAHHESPHLGGQPGVVSRSSRPARGDRRLLGAWRVRNGDRFVSCHDITTQATYKFTTVTPAAVQSPHFSLLKTVVA